MYPEDQLDSDILRSNINVLDRPYFLLRLCRFFFLESPSCTSVATPESWLDSSSFARIPITSSA